MRIRSTNRVATPEATYTHHPLYFVVREACAYEWHNPIRMADGRYHDIVHRESYFAGDVIHGESWRPEGVIMCHRCAGDGCAIDNAIEMFLPWSILAHCDLGEIAAD